MTTANGHARPVTLIPLALPEHGPVSGWPQDDPGQSRTLPDGSGRWRHAVSAFRRNWWRLVFATVGAVAAVVSYGHIVNLFLSWHASSLDARLMPVAIDGLIIIGAGAARGGQKWLGWSAIGPGLAASLYANVMNGLPHGHGAAMGSGWATVALFLATNVMERWKAAPADGADVQAAVAPAVLPLEDSPPDKQPDSEPDKRAARIPPRKVTTRTPRRDRAMAAIARHPDWTDEAVAKSAAVSTKTVQRARNAAQAAEPERPI